MSRNFPCLVSFVSCVFFPGGGPVLKTVSSVEDSKGRDPAVSYGDVQLQRHLERFQKLVLVAQRGQRSSSAPIGREAEGVAIIVCSMTGKSSEVCFGQFRW